MFYFIENILTERHLYSLFDKLYITPSDPPLQTQVAEMVHKDFDLRRSSLTLYRMSEMVNETQRIHDTKLDLRPPISTDITYADTRKMRSIQRMNGHKVHYC